MKVALAQSIAPVATRRQWLHASEARIEGQLLEVTAETCGRVDRVLVSDNQLVGKGQPLVTLDPRDLDRQLEQAAIALAGAVAAAAAGQRLAGRVKMRPSFGVAEARKRYVLARLERLNAEIRAPAKGRVLATAVRPGDSVLPGQPLVSIVDSDDLWVMARFDPADFVALRVGQRARVTAGLRHFDATVSGFITPDDPVLLEFDTRPEVALRPGMHAAATVIADAGDRIVPALAADVCG